MDEYVQINTSLVGSSLPPSTFDLLSIEPVVAFSSSLGSHPMITWAKLVSSILANQQILVFLAHLDFFILFLHPLRQKDSNLLIKNPTWFATMDEKIRALQQDDT